MQCYARMAGLLVNAVCMEDHHKMRRKIEIIRKDFIVDERLCVLQGTKRKHR